MLNPEKPTPPPSPSRLYRRSASRKCDGNNWPRWGLGGGRKSLRGRRGAGLAAEVIPAWCKDGDGDMWWGGAEEVGLGLCVGVGDGLIWSVSDGSFLMPLLRDGTGVPAVVGVAVLDCVAAA